jgi:GT2 family glycosyltransferase
MISVLIPYVQDRGWLESAVDSVCCQTYKDWQLIPICGRRTQGANINRGLRIAKGEYIKILHDDDRLPYDALENLYNGIRGFDFVCGDQQTFGELRYCPEPKVYRGCLPEFEKMLEGNQIYGGTTLYRKDVLEAVGGYDEDLWTGEEYDLHLRLLKKGYKCNYIPKVTHLYRLHETNKSYHMGPGEKKYRREFIREIAKRHG